MQYKASQEYIVFFVDMSNGSIIIQMLTVGIVLWLANKATILVFDPFFIVTV